MDPRLQKAKQDFDDFLKRRDESEEDIRKQIEALYKEIEELREKNDTEEEYLKVKKNYFDVRQTVILEKVKALHPSIRESSIQICSSFNCNKSPIQKCVFDDDVLEPLCLFCGNDIYY